MHFCIKLLPSMDVLTCTRSLPAQWRRSSHFRCTRNSDYFTFHAISSIYFPSTLKFETVERKIMCDFRSSILCCFVLFENSVLSLSAKCRFWKCYFSPSWASLALRLAASSRSCYHCCISDSLVWMSRVHER